MRLDPRDLTTRPPATPAPAVTFPPPGGERPGRPDQPAAPNHDANARGRTPGADRRPALRTGHRRDLERSLETRRTATERQHAALVDLATHRAIATRDLIDQQFGGHPYAGRRSIDAMKRGGLIDEHEVAGPQGGTFTVLTVTRDGAARAEQLAPAAGCDPSQKVWSGLGRKGDLTHDVAIYRAVTEARTQLAEAGAHVRRIRLDAELRGDVAAKSEAARARSGRAAADQARHQAATDAGLHINDAGKVSYPDAQLEYDITDADGERTTGRVNIEVASEHYGPGQVAAKAAAGMAVFAANGKAGRTITSALSRAAKSLDKTGGQGGGGGRGRDPASVEL